MEPVYVQIRRMVWIVQTLRQHGPLSFKDLNAKWRVTTISEGIDIPESTLYRALGEIELAVGVKIHKRYGKFRIRNIEALEGSTNEFLMNSISSSVTFLECKTMSDRIIVDRVPSDNGRFFVVSSFVQHDLIVEMDYLRYEGTVKRHTVEAYCLKYYCNRWYLLGRYDWGGWVFFSLDRIVEINSTGKKFHRSADFDAGLLLADVFGVYFDEDMKAERVIIEVTSNEACYLRDVPIHDSQQELVSDDGRILFEYHLKPTRDFQAKILSRGPRVKVLQPQWVVEEICNTLRMMSSNY